MRRLVLLVLGCGACSASPVEESGSGEAATGTATTGSDPSTGSEVGSDADSATDGSSGDSTGGGTTGGSTGSPPAGPGFDPDRRDAYCQSASPAAHDHKPSDFPVGTPYGADLVVENERDQVQAALEQGGVIWLEDRTWTIDRALIPRVSNTTLHGGVLRRAPAQEVVVTQAADAGATRVYVDDVSAFRIGQTVTVSDPGAPNGGVGFDESWYPGAGVWGVGSDYLDLSPQDPLPVDVPAGARLFGFTDLINLQWFNPTENLRIVDVIFDGNVEENPYTHDWRFNTALRHHRVGGSVECSLFENSPAETIVGHDLQVLHSEATNLYGSFFHFSGMQSGQILIDNVNVSDTNRSTQALSDHAEGVLTFSNNSGDVEVRSSTFTNGLEGAWGEHGADDCDVFATDTVFESFRVRYFTPPLPCLDDRGVTYIDTPVG